MLDPRPIESTQQLRVACEATFANGFEFHDSLASTNDRGCAISATATDLPLVIYAAEQTQGRGRGSHRWWTSSGGLTFSLVLDPSQLGIPESRWSTLSLVSAMAVGRVAVGQGASSVSWKWPNDVLAERRKLSGILLEVPPHDNRRLVIGFGVNVNNLPAEVGAAAADAELASRVVSLRELTHRSHPLPELLANVLREFHNLSIAVAAEPQLLPELWNDRCVLRNKHVVLRIGNRIERGMACGVETHGGLRLETESGLQSFVGGTVVSYED